MRSDWKSYVTICVILAAGTVAAYWTVWECDFISLDDAEYVYKNRQVMSGLSWAGWQYAHNMIGAVITGAFAVSSVGAYYLLAKRDTEYGRVFLKVGIVVGVVASVLVAFPTGDAQGKNVALHQPVTLAAMEGLFETKEGAHLTLIGQPDMDKMKIDNPFHIPKMLSFLTYYRWNAEVKGLDAFPQDVWPTNIPLLYYSYHIMVGLGTIFIAILLVAAVLLWRHRLYSSLWMLWILSVSSVAPRCAAPTPGSPLVNDWARVAHSGASS